jgi:putative transposase
MHKRSRKPSQKKAESFEAARVANVGAVAVDVGAELREVMIRGGLALIAALLEEEMRKLCGAPYERSEKLATRWGSGLAQLVLGGRRVTVKRPRARRNGSEVPLPIINELQREDPLEERALEQMVLGVSTRKYARSLEPTPGLRDYGTSKSAVSRRFVSKSAEQLQTALNRSLAKERWVALMIDGICFAKHVVIVALGVDAKGRKHLLSLRQGSTENATLCREMLGELIDRGLRADRSILVVLDGGRGLRKAVGEVFGGFAMVQRCQVHKKRNVVEQLPHHRRAQASHALSEAYRAPTYETALRMLQNQARVLEKDEPSAAASLREGLEETLTVKKLGVDGELAKALQSTNIVENLNGGIRRIAGRVKRCRNGAMALRWAATAALEHARQFRRLKGYPGLLRLVIAFDARDEAIRRDSAIRTA